MAVRVGCCFFCFFKQKTAYEMRISDWSSDVCSSDLNDPQSTTAAEAWRLLGHACHQTRDTLGEIHAFIERAQLSGVSFYDLSNTANRFNSLLRESDINIDREQKRDLEVKVLQVLSKRIEEAQANEVGRASGRERVWQERVDQGG